MEADLRTGLSGILTVIYKIKGLRAKADANPCLFPVNYFHLPLLSAG